MDDEKIDSASHQIRNEGLCYAMSVVQGKYRIPILYTLSQNGPTRYNELSRMIGPVTFRTLSLTLKALEDEGLVNRKDYQQIPPRVEYSLSEKGQSLIPILDMFCEWGELHIDRSHSQPLACTDGRNG
jgi:DNA-binding HxlR family transcriptional regulator